MNGRLAVLTVLCCGSAASADPRDDVLAAWEKSRARVTTVRYTLGGAIDTKEGAGGAKLPPPRPGGTPPRYQGVWLLDIPRRRHRLEETNPRRSVEDKTKYTTSHRIWVCDGETDKSLHPRDKNEWYDGRPDMHIARGDLRTVHVPAQYHPLFIAHGFIPNSRDIPSPGRWPAPVDREEFELQGTGAIGGRPHTILRGEPFHSMREEYWADMGRGGTVGRLITWLGKTDPYMRTDIDYQEVGGVWVPKRWAHTVSRDNRVLQLSRYEVTNVELNPAVSDADFDIPVLPGYVVEEHAFPAKGSGLNPDYPARRTTVVTPDGGKKVIEETGYLTT